MLPRARCEPSPSKPRRGPRRGAPRARARVTHRRDRADRGQRDLRLGPAHLPRAGQDRARVHDRPRVRRHGARRRRRRDPRPVGDRVLGCYHTACGTCFFCLRGVYHKCDHMRVFGHGATARRPPGHAGRSGARADGEHDAAARSPRASPTTIALFAGDVMGTGYHAVRRGERRARRQRRRARARAGRAVRRPGRARRRRGPGVRDRQRAAAPRDRAGVRRDPDPPDRGEARATSCASSPAAAASTPRSTPSVTPTRSTSRSASPARPEPSSRSASTPSPARSTWASSGSRR